MDFNRRELWVRRTWWSRKKALGDRRINIPKNNRARRVNMIQQLWRVLRGHLSVREAEAVVAGREVPAWVFPGPSGQPLTPRGFWQNVWGPLLTRAGCAIGSPTPCVTATPRS